MTAHAVSKSPGTFARRLGVVTLLTFFCISLRVPGSAPAGAETASAEAAGVADALQPVVYGLPFPAGKAIPITVGQYPNTSGHPNGQAWDFAGKDEPVLASADGTVAFAGTDHYWCKKTTNNAAGVPISVTLYFNGQHEKLYCTNLGYEEVQEGTYGNYVILRHADGYYTIYGHLKEPPVNLCTGCSVAKGQTLGIQGNTGNSKSLSGGTGIHLHFQFSKGIKSVKAYDCALPHGTTMPDGTIEQACEGGVCPEPTCPKLGQKDVLYPKYDLPDSKIGFVEIEGGQPVTSSTACSQNNLRSEAWPSSPGASLGLSPLVSGAFFELPWNPDFPTDGQGSRPNKVLQILSGSRAQISEGLARRFLWNAAFKTSPGEVRAVATGIVQGVLSDDSGAVFRSRGWSGFGPNMVIVDHSEVPGLENLVAVYGRLTEKPEVKAGDPVIKTKKLGNSDTLTLAFFEKQPVIGACTAAIGRPVHPEALWGASENVVDAFGREYDFDSPPDELFSRNVQTLGATAPEAARPWTQVTGLGSIVSCNP